MTTLNWKGRAVETAVMTAAREAINETTEAAAEAAKRSHWWGRWSGRLEGAEIKYEYARKTGPNRYTGKFGATRIRGFYGLILEHKTPFLRPAADQEFPKVTQRIKARIR